MALTFESGLDSLMHFVGLKGEEAYHANAADPLHAAFRAKAAVHAGPMGMPMIWALARGKLNSLSNHKREGKALAYTKERLLPTYTCRFVRRVASTACSIRTPIPTNWPIAIRIS